jgi:hypothetical protein
MKRSQTGHLGPGSLSSNRPARPKITSLAQGSPAMRCQGGSHDWRSIGFDKAVPSTAHCTRVRAGTVAGAAWVQRGVVRLPDGAANGGMRKGARHTRHRQSTATTRTSESASVRQGWC